MKCQVSFRHMKASDMVRDYAQERVDKISKLIDRGGEAQVTCSVQGHRHTAHIELVTDGSLRIRGEDSSDDMYGSIDAAVERIVRQVKRYREKIKSHRDTGGGQQLDHQVFAYEEVDEALAQDTPKIVREEHIIAREMTVSDAVMHMNLMSQEFFVFTNAESKKVNVVYCLPGGEYGLIEAQAA